jgi:hypothetical protein
MGPIEGGRVGSKRGRETRDGAQKGEGTMGRRPPFRVSEFFLSNRTYWVERRGMNGALPALGFI